jgi:UDP-GlcNAc:undecaprenyl-phosphate/decaprenyl-phosphate GlcNAc-1-phosphate transferase
MRSYIAAFVVAVVVGGIATPLVRSLALRLGAVALPGGRHTHERAVPRLGGLAILVAFFAPIAGLFLVQSVVAGIFRADVSRVLGLFAGGVIMSGVGLVDDLRGMRAIHKLYAQVAVATLAFACGFRIEAVTLPIVGPLSMGLFALPVTVAWIVGIINAVNLIDGLDGLAAGVVFFACLTNFVVSQYTGVAFVGLTMAATMGAVVGFLVYNFNPARIFMGDSGSYFLGFVLAATSLAGGPRASTPVALLVPVVALGVPIFDVLLAMVRRILERRSVFSPDRGHIHHRLLDMGITHRRAVLIIYTVSIVFAAAAIAIYLGRSWQVGLALLTASVVLIVLVRLAGYFQIARIPAVKGIAPRTHDVELLRRAIPALPIAMSDATTAREVLAAFDSFCVAAELYGCEVVGARAEEKEVLHSWRPESATSRRDEVASRFPLGRIDQRPLEVRFAWSSEYGSVSPQSEVLLQVAVDLLESNLSRVRSAILMPEDSADSPIAAAPRVTPLPRARS